jgi:lipoprotein signal peptidase
VADSCISVAATLLFLTAIIEIKNEMAEKKAKNKAGD